MGLYRHKLGVIEAVRIQEPPAALPFEGEAKYRLLCDSDNGQVYDQRQGAWIAWRVGDWIVKDHDGVFYPIPDDLFRLIFDEVPHDQKR